MIKSAQDILDTGLRLAGELSTSDYRTTSLDELNRVYLAILSGSNEFDVDLGEAWTFAKAERPATIVLEPKVSGSATVTIGSASGTFSAAPAVSLAKRDVKFGDDKDWYNIVTHVAGSTNFTLDSEYQGDAGGLMSYDAYALEYDTIPGILRLIAPFHINRSGSEQDGDILGIDYDTMQVQFPLMYLRVGPPTRFAVKYQDLTTNTYNIRFNKFTLDKEKVTYDYVPYPTALTDSSSSKPKIPETHRMVLAYGVAYYVLYQKNDDKKDEMYKQFVLGLKSLAKAFKREQIRIGPNRGKLIPRRGQIEGLGRWGKRALKGWW